MWCWHKWKRTGDGWNLISRVDNRSVIGVIIEQECEKCGKLAHRKVR